MRSPNGRETERLWLEVDECEARSLLHACAYLIDTIGGKGVPVLTSVYARLDVLLDKELQR
jgi:hypothetical protein